TPPSERALSAHSDLDEQSSLSEDIQLLRSCESCRRKKRKCSGDRPSCTRCKAQGESCTYRPTARFLKPRADGDPLAQRKAQHAKKKRASIATTPLYRMCGSASPAHAAHTARPRAASVLAALRNGHHQQFAASPADLMYGPPLGAAHAGLPPAALCAAVGASPQPGLAPATSASGLAYMSTTATPSGGSLSAFSWCDDESPSLVQPVSDQQYLYPQCLGTSQPAADYTQMLASAITQQQAAAALISAASMGATPMMYPSQPHNASPMPDMPAAYFPAGAHAQQLASLTSWPAAYPDPALLGAAMALPVPMAPTIQSLLPPARAMPADAGDGAAASYAGALDAILPQSKNALSEWFAQ
ncbi:hypothetical protein H4R21_004591, partial [Coemansia helicoidea]